MGVRMSAVDVLVIPGFVVLCLIPILLWIWWGLAKLGK